MSYSNEYDQTAYKGDWPEPSWRDDQADDSEPKRRMWISVLLLVLLATIGSGSAFLWRAYGAALRVFAPTESQQTVELQNLADAQKAATAIAQTNQQLLQAQAAEMKRLSDTVAQLVVRLDAFEVSTRNAQVAALKEVPKKLAPKRVGPKSLPRAPAALAPMQIAPEEKE